MNRPDHELAEVIRAFGPAYEARYGHAISPTQRRAMRDIVEKVANWVPFVLTDGRLVTGQNPASSRAGAEALLKLLA